MTRVSKWNSFYLSLLIWNLTKIVSWYKLYWTMSPCTKSFFFVYNSSVTLWPTLFTKMMVIIRNHSNIEAVCIHFIKYGKVNDILFTCDLVIIYIYFLFFGVSVFWKWRTLKTLYPHNSLAYIRNWRNMILNPKCLEYFRWSTRKGKSWASYDTLLVN